MTQRPLLVMSFTAVLVAAFGSAVPAAAAPPVSEIVIVDPAPYTDEGRLCGDESVVTFSDNGEFKLTIFYDRAGNPTRSIVTNYRVRYTVTAAANGKTLTTHAPAVVIEDFHEGVELFLGLHNAYHLPGRGVILLDAGHVILDLVTHEPLFQAGQQQFLDGDADAFCDFFFPV